MLEIKIYKNWKELCEVMGWKTTRGNYKAAKEKDLSQICSWHKVENSNKIQVTEIYAEQKKRVDYRVNNGGSEAKKLPQFKLNKEDSYKSGVYKIEMDNRVYIGSTKNFRERYLQHLRHDDELAPYVYELLKDDNHGFEVLEMVEDLSTLTEREQHWIEFYLNLEGYEVVNRKKAYRKEEPKVKKINIRINEVEYERAIEILKENGIEIY